MSHIHVTDGFFHPFLGIAGYLITGLIIFLILKKVKETDLRRKIPMTGVVAALMLIGMSVPLGPLPVHLSLAVLSGIIAGPSLGFIAVFVVNFLLAFFGHGGMTVVGLNTLIIGSEVFVGSLLFRLLSKKLTIFKSAGLATAFAVVVSMSLMVGVVGTSGGASQAIAEHFTPCSVCNNDQCEDDHHEHDSHEDDHH
ncbi:energy-coupling factor ABC transporter permease, partial [Herbivorax sp. ANBcel31]|uniref:energy-coupling factor ABC transporter permease n=1 Tax=Herbivorax sp. ANBcel31 TaxID=3069754 RepID=UPI0027B1ED36